MANLLSVKFKYLMQLGAVDLASDAFRIILMEPNYTFSEDFDDTYADVSASELPTAYGYTVNGQLLSGVSITESEAENLSTVTWNPVSWTVCDGQLATSGAIIYDDTVSSPVANPIVGWIDFGGTQTLNQYAVLAITNLKLIQR